MPLDEYNWRTDLDFEYVLKVLGKDGVPDRVPVLEFLVDPEVVAAVLDEPTISKQSSLDDDGAMKASLDQLIRFNQRMGISAFRAKAILDLPFNKLKAVDTAVLTRGDRKWIDESAGLVTNWEQFEKYPWPTERNADYSPIEYVLSNLPDGMGIFAKSYGVLEQAMFLMGYETFAFCLYDNPDLVQAIFDKIAEIYLPFNRALTELERVAGLWMGDDMGYRGGPMIKPDHLRHYVLPIQKEIAEMCHKRGLLFLMHSCGDLSMIMEDLIEDVGIDAKHSFEDVIQPVDQFVEQYAHRIAVIGGIDVDLLARGTEQQIRARVREVLETGAASRAYALGSGNSITNYIPPESFLAMVDECYRFNGMA